MSIQARTTVTIAPLDLDVIEVTLLKKPYALPETNASSSSPC